MRRYILGLIFLMTQQIVAQNAEEQSTLEKVFSDQELELMSTQEIDYWLDLFAHPKDINKLKPYQLMEIYGLTYDELTVFLEYKKTFGKLINAREIDRLDWVESTKKRVKQATFIDSKDKESLSAKDRWQLPDQHFLMLNTSLKIPFDDELIVPFSTQLRGRWTRKNDYSVGMNIQHQNDELFKWNPKSYDFGTSYSSAHVALYNKGRFRKIILGDFQMIGGQGLVFGGGYFLGKGGDPLLSVYRGQDGIRPYNSMANDNFFRGAATDITWSKSINSEMFVGCQKKEAYVQVSDDDELVKREIEEKIYGARLGYHQDLFDVHLNTLMGNYNQEIKMNSRNDSLGIFSGKSFINTSFDVSFRYQNFHVVSEVATSLDNSYALNTTLFTHLLKGVDWVILYRKYSPNYVAPYANSLGELSRVSNEEGLYMGLKLEQYKKWGLNLYFDVFKFPYATYQQDAGREGVEFRGSGWYKVKHGQKLQFEGSFQEKGAYYLADSSKVKLYGKKQTIKGSLRYLVEVSKHLNWTLRAQGSYNKEREVSELGYMIYQDLNWDWEKKFYLSTRLAFFDAPSFSTRLYAYEKNIRYAYSFPPYYGVGWRFYVLSKYRFGNGHYLSARWSRTKKEVNIENVDDENSIHQINFQFVLKI
ncbi:hypothetical protein MY04_2612 [Flammeovirga sp. MY04]|uniref:hypothetical protein n=1 Tax=Flammeovirga sp. MY04 TaxID=1191459 RepID=UPI0008063969|nr:hypothetical protein [Flammeovirga sp. MY04]ANQ49981.1 hypothetical protein MY04_2612 [Flammeovirga sp. MY04]